MAADLNSFLLSHTREEKEKTQQYGWTLIRGTGFPKKGEAVSFVNKETAEKDNDGICAYFAIFICLSGESFF